MDARNFLKVQNFKLKVENFEFEDVKFMTSTQKSKIYKNFVSFLNNHFKPTSFKKIYTNIVTYIVALLLITTLMGFMVSILEQLQDFTKLLMDLKKNPQNMMVFM